jgi:tetratricopeptide (TPR) repeat protein
MSSQQTACQSAQAVENNNGVFPRTHSRSVLRKRRFALCEARQKQHAKTWREKHRTSGGEIQLDSSAPLVYTLTIVSTLIRYSRRGLLALLLLGIPAVARARDSWIEAKSAHFIVTTNAGEKEAKKIANQFEQIRGMFHSVMPAFRVDPANPILIIAVKNETTLKQLLPEEYEIKGHIHHAGMYQPGEDRDYVIMRLDAEGDHPFHTLYHEYTHALLRLNFDHLPLWLDEGLAEFFGNSTLGDIESKTGTIDSGHLYLLQQSKLIPIDTLLEVDHQSPYYNETDRASVFYAESWALLHFLLMSPDARKAQLLGKFLAGWLKTGNQTAAAREAFGDLKQFGKLIESYSRQSSFHIGFVKNTQLAEYKNYAMRSISPGEVQTLRGDFFAHHNREEAALSVLNEAVKMEPNLAAAHEALGYCEYRMQQYQKADEEMKVALRLGSTSFATPYFHGTLLLDMDTSKETSAKEAITSLEKATQMNPQYAPAYDGLASAYSRFPEMQEQAVNAAIKAVKLDPATIPYAVHLTYLLMNNDRDVDAKVMAERLVAVASNAVEKRSALELLRRVQEHAEWTRKRQSPGQPGSAHSSGGPSTTNASKGTSQAEPVSAPDRPPAVTLARPSFGVDGVIDSLECGENSGGTITLRLSNGRVSFHTADLGNVVLSWADGVTKPTVANCSKWKGRQVKVWFLATPGTEFTGEITKLYFF